MMTRSELWAARSGVGVERSVEDSESDGLNEVGAKTAGDRIESGLEDVKTAVSVTADSMDGASEVVSCCWSERGSAVGAGSGPGWLDGPGARLDASSVEGAVKVESCSGVMIDADSGTGVDAVLVGDGAVPLEGGLSATAEEACTADVDSTTLEEGADRVESRMMRDEVGEARVAVGDGLDTTERAGQLRPSPRGGFRDKALTKRTSWGQLYST